MKKQLLLENQLCFPLYAASKAVTKLYLPYLNPLGITYTQYIVLLVLLEKDGLTLKQIGARTFLDSGTLSPLLEKLIAQGLIEKSSGLDKREKKIFLTQKGKDMEEKLAPIPAQIGNCLHLEKDEAGNLYYLAYKILENLEDGKNF